MSKILSRKYVSRRDIVKAMGLGAITACFAGAATTKPASAATEMTADQALQRLLDGNKRWVQAKLEHPDQTVARLQEVAKGQNPFAVVLGCADSRVSPELIFDQGVGDLFVTRVAGNFVDDNLLGSIEFATANLGAPLILVLGHERCGAIQATVKAVQEGAKFPGHLADFVDAIRPAAESVKKEPGDPIENAIKANVLRNVEKLKLSRPILAKLVEENKLKVVGGRYDLDTGEVTLYS